MFFEEFLRPTTRKRVFFFYFFDLLISFVTLYSAFLLRFNFEIPSEFFPGLWTAYGILVPIKVFFFFYFRIYFVAWRFFSLSDMVNLIKAHIAAYALFALVFIPTTEYFFPRSVIIIDLFLSFLFISGFRISKRLIIESKATSPNTTIIIGATPRTTQAIKSFLNQESDYYPIAIFDEEPSLQGTYFNNVRVHAMENLEAIAQKHDVQSALIAKDFEPEELDTIFGRLKQAHIQTVKIIKYFDSEDSKEIQDISIEDLLARKPKDLDQEVLQEFVENKTILITGAGGSIGSEITRQCARLHAKKLILVDNGEYNLYAIMEELESQADCQLLPLMISITQREKLDHILAKEKPNLILHAAAYKHVPLCESNPESAVENNISGSLNVINLGIQHQVEKIVIISTDKAVRPTNIMGATKRVVELYAQNVNSGQTEIAAVRFGNVLGSSGSVIPKFRKQIEQGGPITVTHPDMERYFMLISEACQLVLQAGAIAKGGEIFILDMGEPVKIVDMAEKMIQLSGREDIQIQFTSLRPGEKLYEELLIDESECKTRYESIHVAQSEPIDIDQLNKSIRQLLQANDKTEALRQIVPEFTPPSF